MKFIKNLGVTTAALCFASYGMAQDQDFEIAGDVPDTEVVAIEVQPLPVIMSAVPGFGAFGAGIEARIGNHIAVHVDATYADMNMRGDWVSDAVAETNEPMPKSGYSYGVTTGVRYYDDPVGDSLYAGGAATYGEGHTSWEYEEDQKYDVDVFSISPSLSAGYRWVWNNGVLVRLGAGAGAPRINSATITPQSEQQDAITEDGKDRIDDLIHQNVVARVDFGLGYSF